jgi:FkbM family methyltransferase
VIHFLNLDCERSEREALIGADFAHFRPWIVLVEATVPNSPEECYREWEDLLSEADYRFVWFDGLNRFYVAAEHHDRLAKLLALPPNVFDNFVRSLEIPQITPPTPPIASSAPLLTTTPTSLSEEARIALAQRCRDCDEIPKVSDAGKIQFEPDGTRVQIMHNGLKVVADGYYGEWMTRLITLCQGHHEPQEERVFDKVVTTLPANATMLELGGYWCYYTAWFLQGAPARHAVVLEPDPAHLAVGKSNLQLNGLNAQFIAGFAGADPAEQMPFTTERCGLLLLPRFSVPQILRNYGIDVLDVLHCDTQGAEFAILSGARDLFVDGRIRWVFVSTHVHQISGDPLTHRRCLDLLRECGAIIESEHSPHESYSGDGLIVARFGPAPADWRPVAVSVARQSETLFRELAFDLSDTLSRARVADDVAFRVVSGVYEALLFRHAEPAALADHSHAILYGNVAEYLRAVIRSPEFTSKSGRFISEYLGESHMIGTSPLRFAGNRFGCTGLRLVLERDAPLGHTGESLLVPNDKVILPSILSSGSWCEQHLAFLAEHLDPASVYTLLDIGANIGLFSRQVLKAFGNFAECHCLEPDPGNYEALCFNLARPLGAITRTYPIGLGEKDGRVTFFRDNENCGNYSIHADAMRGRPFTETTVDILAAGPWLERNLRCGGPILWKSDTQGNDETIVSQIPWQTWHRIQIAIIELWRVHKGAPVVGFLERVAGMPNRRLGADVVSVEEIKAYIEGDDWQHEDLYLWR